MKHTELQVRLNIEILAGRFLRLNAKRQWVASSATKVQVTDIAIIPEHQGRGLGKMIMAALTDHIEKKLPETAYVSLIADDPANRLYRQFGFTETAPRSVGMARKVC